MRELYSHVLIKIDSNQCLFIFFSKILLMGITALYFKKSKPL